jgi:hypothetical protein
VSNHLAIATVTAALKEIINKAILGSGEFTGTDLVTTGRPSAKPAAGQKAVNIFLHHVRPSAHWRNAELPTRRQGGALVQRPTVALDLQYVFTFYGDDGKWEPQRLCGLVLQTLQARPILSRELVKKVVASVGAVADFSFIRKSNLAEALEQVRITPETLSLDELSRLWSSFYQTEYALSTVYLATPVFIEAEETIEEALPVRERPIVHAVTFELPHIDEVKPVDPAPFIVAGGQLRIEGAHLRGEVTRLLLDDAPFPGTVDVQPDLVSATLPAGLYAGVHTLQISHLFPLGQPAKPHRGFESNLAAFPLYPVLGALTVANKTTRTVGAVTLVSGTLQIAVTPNVERRQRVVLFLNGTGSAGGGYSFVIGPRPDGPADPLDAPSVDIPFVDVPAGTYAVRVQVAGVTSVPDSTGAFPTVVLS